MKDAAAVHQMAGQVLSVLPQTQCTRCGYPDCAAYAQAIVQDAVAINQCPPGGAAGVALISHVLGKPELATLPLNPAHGVESPRQVAWIDEDWCIGCTLCIKACPVDAIIGSNKKMHTVIEANCTGCELCIPVCPTDCIQLENASGDQTGWAAWSQGAANKAAAAYGTRQTRLMTQERLERARLNQLG